MIFEPTTTELETGELYGDLWKRYDDKLFQESVALFEKRWRANGEPLDYFRGKRCLDAGCGGGRYSIAMALMGAASVAGIDLSPEGLHDARERQRKLGLEQIEFRRGSVLDLPFADGEFDFVCCSGVLHHTPGVERGLRELARVLKPGGQMYLLLYGAGGLFWPSMLILRALAAVVGRDVMEAAVEAAGVAANLRRSLLDDLFVPLLETYSHERVEFLLRSAGFAHWRYWTTGNLDHETDTASLIRDLETRFKIWSAAGTVCPGGNHIVPARHGEEILRAVIQTAAGLQAECEAGRLPPERLREAVIGHGHHRLIAERA